MYHMQLTSCMLADGARLGQDGKLYIFGGQWDQIFSPVVPTQQKLAFALVISVGYSEALKDHQVDLVLEDEDGGDLGVKVGGVFRPGHPPLTQEGSPVTVPIAIEPPPVPIQNYGRFRWKVIIDGKLMGELPMTVRSPANMGLPFQQAG